MKTDLKQVQEEVSYYSGKTSELVRQLALAGIGVVWIFKVGDKEAAGVHWRGIMYLPLVFFVGSLLIDLLQNTHYLGEWDKVRLKKEEERAALPAGQSLDEEADFPDKAHSVGRCMHWGKILAMLGGYLALLLAVFIPG